MSDVGRFTRGGVYGTSSDDEFWVRASDYDALAAERDEYARCLDGETDCAKEKLALRTALGWLVADARISTDPSVYEVGFLFIHRAREVLKGLAVPTSGEQP